MAADSSPITKESLLAGIKYYKIEVDDPEKESKKSLEKIIDKWLKESGKELEYQCPSCGKDLPEVNLCPYCSEEFGESESEKADQEEEKEEEKKTDKKNKGKDAGKKEKEKAKKDKEKEKAKKDTEKNEEKPKKEKKERKAADYSKFEAALETVRDTLDDSWEEKERSSGHSYFKETTRLLKVVKKSNATLVEINVEGIDPDHKGYKILTPDEIERGKLGSVKGIFTGDDMNVLKKIVKEATKKFKPSDKPNPFLKKGKKDKKDKEEE